MKDKARRLFSDYKYSLIVFVFLSVQAIINLIPLRDVGEYLYPFYLVDLSMGKTSRLIIGTVVNWLTDTPSLEWVNGFVIVFVFVGLLLASLMTGKAISRAEKELKPHALVFALFFVSGSFTFANFSKFLGFFDIYMFLIALFAIIFLNNKYLKWLVPVLCALGVEVHHGFAISFFPVIALAALYKIFAEEKKAANSAVFVLSVAAVAAFAVFVAIYGTETVTVSYEEMRAVINERSSIELSEEAFSDIGFYFYDLAPQGSNITEGLFSELSFTESLDVLVVYINEKMVGSSNGLIAILSLAALLFAVFAVIWIKCIKNTDSKGKKFVYVCFMLAMLIVPFYCMFAADYIRWVQAGTLTQFALAFFMFFSKDEPFRKTVAQLGDFFKTKKMLLVIIYLVYALSVQHDITG